MANKGNGKAVETLVHDEATRKNIPTAEHESVLAPEHQEVEELRYPRNPDLDPQLVWRGKDEQDCSDLVVPAPPVYIQEKVHPKVLIDNLMSVSEPGQHAEGDDQPDLFADFDEAPDGGDRAAFYEHDHNWSNRMILGDSLQVMASLAERERLRGKVQCIYIDPPYGINFKSNFQWSTTTRDVKDNPQHITREPEQVKAFRDTWRDGIHSYLTYLRDRLTVARDLLSESGSIFVQIGDENVHRVRALMDEVFGEDNFVGMIFFKTTGGLSTNFLASVGDYLLWYSRRKEQAKFRPIYRNKKPGEPGATQFKYELCDDGNITEVGFEGASQLPPERAVYHDNLTSQGNEPYPYLFRGTEYVRGYKPSPENLRRLDRAGRITVVGATPRYLRKLSDFPVFAINELWDDVSISGFADPKIYVVRTAASVIQRCVLMTTDPGDLVLDPTCGSGTTPYVAENWGRRWITIDTSRVALALARARIMGARYPYYLLSDSPEGQQKEAEVTRTAPSAKPTHGDIRQGFVYQRVPHITLKSIANNTEIDVIWERFQEKMEPLRKAMNEKCGLKLEEWQIPYEPGAPWPDHVREQHERFMRVKRHATKQKAIDRINETLGRNYSVDTLPEHPIDYWTDPELLELHQEWWAFRIQRQKEIDASIAAKADFECLYDKPYEDPKTVRVSGPFTVESLSPHRTLGVDDHDELIDPLKARERPNDYAHLPEFGQMVLENLRIAGVQQAHKENKIEFTSLQGWPGTFICAEGRYQEGATEKRAGIFVGPEFGTVRRVDLVEAAKEAGDTGFDVVIACAFNYEPHASELTKLGRVPVLKARMNADLHMADDLKNTRSGNLFVIFGEPDLDLFEEKDQIRVKLNGVDVFDPNTGEVRSDDANGIACWFVDTDYNGESFFVRQAYFLGANDPYKALKTTLKAEIDADAWDSLYSDTSRPFPRPQTGRIAVKVINHLGDEVMKVFRV